MKANSIISKYIFREMIPPFVVSTLVLTFIFLMAKILDITDLIVNYGVSISSVLLMLTYFIPSFMVYVMPMSIMMGVLLCFLRLSHDNEVIALKASGFSIYRFLPAVFVFCLIGYLITCFMSIYGSPWGRLSFNALLLETATSNIDIGLKARTFNDSFKDVMLYVNEIDPEDKMLTDVFIEDRQTPGMVGTIIAPRGQFLSDPANLTFGLTLYNGIVNTVDLRNKAVHSVSFDTYDFSLELAQVLSAKKYGRKGRKEMSLTELRQKLESAANKDAKYNLALMEYHKKFSLPFACFVLGLLAVPLGIHSRSAKRSLGMVLGVLFFLIYYILLSAGWVFGEAGMFPPVLGMWFPNLVIGSVGLYLLIQSAKERRLRAISILLGIFMRREYVCTDYNPSQK